MDVSKININEFIFIFGMMSTWKKKKGKTLMQEVTTEIREKEI
jgi:hypothetical protein